MCFVPSPTTSTARNNLPVLLLQQYYRRVSYKIQNWPMRIWDDRMGPGYWRKFFPKKYDFSLCGSCNHPKIHFIYLVARLPPQILKSTLLFIFFTFCPSYSIFFKRRFYASQKCNALWIFFILLAHYVNYNINLWHLFFLMIYFNFVLVLGWPLQQKQPQQSHSLSKTASVLPP